MAPGRFIIKENEQFPTINDNLLEEIVTKYDDLKIFSNRIGSLAKVLPEMIALIENLRESTEVSLDEVENQLDLICKNLGFFKYRYTKQDPNKEYFLISRKKLDLEELGILEDEGLKKNVLHGHKERQRALGDLFGYPRCCIRSFEGKQETFLLNMDWLIKNHKVIDYRINPFFVSTGFQTFVHLPCSIECKETIKSSQKLLDIIKEKYSLLHEKMIYLLKLPIFYIDFLAKGIVFEGILENDSIHYQNFYFSKKIPVAPKDNEFILSKNSFEDIIVCTRLIKALQYGDFLTFDGEHAIVKKDSEIIDKIRKPKNLLWKFVEFR